MNSIQSYLTISILVIGILFQSPVGSGQQPGPDTAIPANTTELPRYVEQQLDDVVIPALKTKQDRLFYNAASPMVEKLDDEVLDLIETHVQAATNLSFKKKFVAQKVLAIEQGNEPAQQKMKRSVAKYFSSAIVERIEGELADLDAHAIMATPLELPDGWRDSELLFWHVHVFKNRLLNLNRVATYNESVAVPFIKRAKKDDDQELLLAFQGADQLVKKVADSYKRMLENEAELRIRELKKCEEALSSNTDFETRLNAAFAMESHKSNLLEFFANFDPAKSKRPLLKDDGIVDEVKVLLANSMEYGQDVIEKARLLRVGAHFWLRGRYGAGPLAKGLLKAPAALKSEDAMFGLFMPKERPRPIASTSLPYEGTSPGYDRRHYYTWAVEYRPRSTSLSTTFGTKKTTGTPGQVSAKATFW